MARYRETVPSSRSQTETFDYLAEFSNIREWDPSVPEAKPIGDGPPAVGKRYSVTFEFGRKPKELVYEVVEYDRPAHFRVVAEDSSFVSDDTIEVAPDGAVTYDADVKLKGLLRPFDPVLRVMFGRIGDKAAGGLKERLAAGGS